MTRKRADIREVASSRGYTDPGGLTFERLARDEQILRGWLEFIDAGTIPPELGMSNIGDARRLVKRELAAYTATEIQLLPFFYGRMSSVEMSGSMDVSLVDALQALAAREKEAPDGGGSKSGS